MNHNELRRTIILLSIGGFVNATTLRICDPMLPVLASGFNITVGQASLVISCFSGTYSLMQLIYGPLGDRYGKYRLITWSNLACMVANLGALCAGSIDMLASFRVVSGATAAATIPLAMAWIGDHVPYDERQATLARFLIGQIMGFAGGQIIGGFFADTFSWRWAFLFTALLYLVIGLLLFAELRRRPELGHRGDASDISFSGRMISVMQRPWAWVVLATVYLEGAMIFGTFAFVPAYLHTRFSIPLTAAGAVLGTYSLGGLVFAVVARHLVLRLGEQGLALAGGLILITCFPLLNFANSWVLVIPLCIVIGIGYYMLHNTLQINATQMAPTVRGTAVSLFACAFFLGQASGVEAAAFIVDRDGMEWLFVIAGIILLLLGCSFSLALRYRRELPRHSAVPS